MELLARLANLPGALPGACAQGLIWGIMAIGVYLTYRILVDSPSQSHLAQWVFVVLDGYLGRLAGGGLDPGADTAVLLDTVGRLLRP